MCVCVCRCYYRLYIKPKMKINVSWESRISICDHPYINLSHWMHDTLNWNHNVFFFTFSCMAIMAPIDYQIIDHWSNLCPIYHWWSVKMWTVFLLCSNEKFSFQFNYIHHSVEWTNKKISQSCCFQIFIFIFIIQIQIFGAIWSKIKNDYNRNWLIIDNNKNPIISKYSLLLLLLLKVIGSADLDDNRHHTHTHQWMVIWWIVFDIRIYNNNRQKKSESKINNDQISRKIIIIMPIFTINKLTHYWQYLSQNNVFSFSLFIHWPPRKSGSHPTIEWMNEWRWHCLALKIWIWIDHLSVSPLFHSSQNELSRQFNKNI